MAHVQALYPGSRSVEILRERYDEPTAIIERVTLGLEACAEARGEAYSAIETRRESWLLAADENGVLTERDRTGFVVCFAPEMLKRSGMIGIETYRIGASFQQDHRCGRTPLFGDED